MSATNIQDLNAKMQALIEHVSPPPNNPTEQYLSESLNNPPSRNAHHNQLKAVDAEKYAAGDNAAKTAVNEIEGRNAFANMLINDKSGKLSMMTGGDPSNPADFGAEIKNKALILTQ
ncbi:hypothetical protein PITC_001500 [Penicillium italicum]|uniref:Uncharacterized protein n=1 Tax=Penicillium italicum TaxID=40296 RepID=A0A0A2L7X8_PENIT|nr:hypothetical protein PITC_001500 [Penicillium italicum]